MWCKTIEEIIIYKITHLKVMIALKSAEITKILILERNLFNIHKCVLSGCYIFFVRVKNLPVNKIDKNPVFPKFAF